MIARLLLLLMIPAFLGSCGMEKARRAEPVSFGRVERAHAAAAQGLATAKDRHAAANRALAVSRGSIGRAKAGLAAQLAALEALQPRVADLARHAPPELRPEVESIQQHLADLAAQSTAIAADTASAETAATEAAAAQSSLGTALEATNAAVANATAETTVATQTALDTVAKANANAELADAAQTRVRELVRKNWIRRALEALAAIALIVGGILYLTGKLTFAGLRTAKSVADAAR
jgi:chromosome segregation ATPase